ncbi:uncharacterized protein [Montipora foliosa]
MEENMPETRSSLLQDDLNDHYCKVADNYDDYYMELEDAQLQNVVESLDLQTDHVMVDVGGGTGRFAEEIFKLARLKKQIFCVEPSAEMLEKTKGREGVIPVLKTGEEFFADPSLRDNFDRVMFKYSFHHLSDPLPVFKDVERSLRSDGFCLILSIRSITFFKRFAEVTGLATEYHPQEEIHETSRMLQKANLDVETSLVKLKCNFRKAKFYSMLRGRFMSSLFKLTDQEIEKGIEMLEQGELGQIEDNDEVEGFLTHVVIKAKKTKNQSS